VRRGYRPVTVYEAATRQAEGKRLVVTFDDALRSVFTLGLPVLERLGAVATVYAPSVPIAQGTPMAWPEVARHLQTKHAAELEPASVEQLLELSRLGWEIGSHTRTHPWLPNADDDELDRELAGSKKDLEQLLGVEVRTLAYPFGSYDARVALRATQAGYVAAVTLPVRVPTWPKQPTAAEAMELPRIGVYRVDEWRRFRLKVARPVRLLRASPFWDLVQHVNDLRSVCR
jgi:peptidoglycan/xylan/chitin deacetylase (PgdA/CDA1 family)